MNVGYVGSERSETVTAYHRFVATFLTFLTIPTYPTFHRSAPGRGGEGW